MNRVTIGTAVLVLLAACGGDEASITAEVATRLGAQVADARAVAAAGDYVQAAGLLDEIDASVGDLLERGDLSEQRADDVTAAVDEVRGALAAFVATTTTVATTTVPPTTEPDRDENRNRGNGNGNENENENGKENGNDRGDGDED